MNIQKLFGNTPFEKAQEGIARRVMINGAIMATQELLCLYEDIENGLEMVKDNVVNDPDLEVDGLIVQAQADKIKANTEVIALSNMLEKHMGISA